MGDSNRQQQRVMVTLWATARNMGKSVSGMRATGNSSATLRATARVRVIANARLIARTQRQATARAQGQVIARPTVRASGKGNGRETAMGD